jgi:hypothetical protein
MVQLSQCFFAQVEPMIAFLSLDDLQELCEEAWHAPDDVDRRASVELLDPFYQDDRALLVTGSLEADTDLVDELV